MCSSDLVVQLFAVVALSFACVLHLVMSSSALHPHVFKTCIRSFSPLSVSRSDGSYREGGLGRSRRLQGGCVDGLGRKERESPATGSGD